MVVTRIALPRRTFLRGVGVTLALPFLDAMVPAFAKGAHAAAKPIQRLGFFYVGNGIQLEQYLPPGEATRFEATTPILSPLAPFQEYITLVSGLAHAVADPIRGGNGVHTRAASAWLNGVRIDGSGNIKAATSLDQYAARELGKDTPLLSLELAMEPPAAGVCESGYSCLYLSTFSWRTPTMPLPMESNPRIVFERLFGADGSPSERLARMRRDRSILDAVREDMVRFHRRLGVRDRSTLEEYLDAARDVERRIQKSEERAEAAPTAEKPFGTPDSYEEHTRVMLDLVALAYQADITRVVTLQLARDLSGRAYPQVGVSEGHHDVSHHGSNPDKMAKSARINTYHMTLFAGLVEKLQSTPDGDGSLLDHAMLMYGSNFGDGDHHVPHNLPLLVAGSGCGQLKGGRHLKAPMDTPMMNLGLSLLDKVGVELPSIGDSTGRLADF